MWFCSISLYHFKVIDLRLSYWCQHTSLIQTELWPSSQNKSLGWVDAKPFDHRIAKPLFMYCTIALTNFGPSYSVRTPFSASGTGLDWSKTVFLKTSFITAECCCHEGRFFKSSLGNILFLWDIYEQKKLPNALTKRIFKF